MTRLTSRELADLVPCPLDEVRRLLVSDEAKQSSRSADVAFELVGDVPLKGVSRSVRLHRGVRT